MHRRGLTIQSAASLQNELHMLMSALWSRRFAVCCCTSRFCTPSNLKLLIRSVKLPASSFKLLQGSRVRPTEVHACACVCTRDLHGPSGTMSMKSISQHHADRSGSLITSLSSHSLTINCQQRCGAAPAGRAFLQAMPAGKKAGSEQSASCQAAIMAARAGNPSSTSAAVTCLRYCN